MNKKQFLEQFFKDVELKPLDYWFFTFNTKRYRILDYTLSEIMSRNLNGFWYKDYLLNYSTKL